MLSVVSSVHVAGAQAPDLPERVIGDAIGHVTADATATDGAVPIVNLHAGWSASGDCPSTSAENGVLYGCADGDGDGIYETPAGCFSGLSGEPVPGWAFTVPAGKTLLISDIHNYDWAEWGVLELDFEAGLWSRLKGEFIRVPENSSTHFDTPIAIREGDMLCPLYAWPYEQSLVVSAKLVDVDSFFPLLPLPTVPLASVASLAMLALALGGMVVIRRRRR